jgi:hypothetical protein
MNGSTITCNDTLFFIAENAILLQQNITMKNTVLFLIIMYQQHGAMENAKEKGDGSNKEKLFKTVALLELSISMIKAGTLNTQTHQQ